MKFPLPEKAMNEDPTEPVTYVWREVTDTTLLDSTSLVLVNSAFCAYDSQLGFRIVRPGTGGWQAKPGDSVARNSQGGFSYQLESYSEHIGRMLAIYRTRFAADYAFVEKQISEHWGLPPHALDRAIRLAIALHDLGKLDQRWQRWVRLYQARIGEPIEDSTLMAVHTNWNPDDPKHRQAKQWADQQCQRPPHAAESAVAAARLLGDRCGDFRIGRAAATAIARHHAPSTSEFGSYRLHPAAGTAVVEALALAELETHPVALLENTPNLRLEQILVESQLLDQLLLYYWIVRVLRLCDGMSQEKGGVY